jgi:hypothetical protein
MFERVEKAQDDLRLQCCVASHDGGKRGPAHSERYLTRISRKTRPFIYGSFDSIALCHTGRYSIENL